MAGSHLENRSLAHVSWHWQLQTSWLNSFRQFVWVVKWVTLFCRSYKFYLLTVGRGFTSNNASKRTIKLFFTASSKQSGHWKWKCVGWKGKVLLQFSSSKPCWKLSDFIGPAPAYIYKIIERADDNYKQIPFLKLWESAGYAIITIIIITGTTFLWKVRHRRAC